MKYICIACEEENILNTLSKGEWDALRTETLAYVDDLRKRGLLIAAEALQSIKTSTTVRVRGGKASVTDGPFAETKEQLGGFFLIDARSQRVHSNSLEVAFSTLWEYRSAADRGRT